MAGTMFPAVRMDGEDFERAWRERFERFGQAHEEDAPISGWSPGGLAARFRYFRRMWKPQGAGTWLDAGCGPGTYTRYLAENGQHVVGLDYSLPSLHKARARSPRDIPWIVADVQRLPVAGGRFDGVLCFGVLQALSRPDRAVAELAYVVRPGGWLWIDALNDWCLLSRWRRWRNPSPLHPLRYDSPNRLRRLVEQEGFTDVSVGWVPIAPGSRAGLQRLLDSPFVAWLFRWFRPAAWSLCHAIVLRGRRA